MIYYIQAFSGGLASRAGYFKTESMNSITRTELIAQIRLAIEASIALHRQSKGRYAVQDDSLPVAAIEIRAFIYSSPFYSDALKDFLRGKKEETTPATSQWVSAFILKTKTWATSHEWLHAPISALTDPAANRKQDIVPLELPAANENCHKN